MSVLTHVLVRSLLAWCIFAVAIRADALEQGSLTTDQIPRPKRIYPVSRVVSGDTLELANGAVIQLLGTDVRWDGSTELQAKAKQLLEMLTLTGEGMREIVPGKREIVLEYDDSMNSTDWVDKMGRVRAYVSGGSTSHAAKLLEPPTQELRPPLIVEERGFLDIESESLFWKRPVKWLTVFLNATLIKAGYARADRTIRHRFYDDFLAYEAEAKAAKRGLWPEYLKQN